VAVYAAAIFVQSALPSPADTIAVAGFDKVAHAAMYALLAVLLCRALSDCPMGRRPPVRILAVATLLASLYGIGDELHQLLVPARCANVGDAVADLVGSAVGAACWGVRHRRRFQI